MLGLEAHARRLKVQLVLRVDEASLAEEVGAWERSSLTRRVDQFRHATAIAHVLAADFAILSTLQDLEFLITDIARLACLARDKHFLAVHELRKTLRLRTLEDIRHREPHLGHHSVRTPASGFATDSVGAFHVHPRASIAQVAENIRHGDRRPLDSLLLERRTLAHAHGLHGQEANLVAVLVVHEPHFFMPAHVALVQQFARGGTRQPLQPREPKREPRISLVERVFFQHMQHRGIQVVVVHDRALRFKAAVVGCIEPPHHVFKSPRERANGDHFERTAPIGASLTVQLQTLSFANQLPVVRLLRGVEPCQWSFVAQCVVQQLVRLVVVVVLQRGRDFYHREEIVWERDPHFLQHTTQHRDGLDDTFGAGTCAGSEAAIEQWLSPAAMDDSEMTSSPGVEKINSRLQLEIEKSATEIRETQEHMLAL